MRVEEIATVTYGAGNLLQRKMSQNSYEACSISVKKWEVLFCFVFSLMHMWLISYSDFEFQCLPHVQTTLPLKIPALFSDCFYAFLLLVTRVSNYFTDCIKHTILYNGETGCRQCCENCAFVQNNFRLESIKKLNYIFSKKRLFKIKVFITIFRTKMVDVT